MSYQLIHTHPDRSRTKYPLTDSKADAARFVEPALASVPLGGIAWRQIAQGLMDSPCGDTVLGIRNHHFTIQEV